MVWLEVLGTPVPLVSPDLREAGDGTASLAVEENQAQLVSDVDRLLSALLHAACRSNIIVVVTAYLQNSGPGWRFHTPWDFHGK